MLTKVNIVARTDAALWPGFLLGFLLISPYFLPPGIMTAAMAASLVGLVFFAGSPVRRSYLTLVFPLVLIALLGLSGFFLHGPYDVFRDGWYLAKSLLVILVGLVISEHFEEPRKLFRILVWVSIICSLWFFYQVWTSGFLGLSDRGRIVNRHEMYPLVYIALPLSMWLLVGERRIAYKLFYCGVIVIFSVALALSYSRTIWLSLSIFGLVFLYVKGYVRLTALLVASIVVLFAAIVLTYNKPDFLIEAEYGTFWYKVYNSFTEFIPADYSLGRDLNANWRGYEAYRGLLAYGSGSFLELIFGQGFGASIDLGFFAPLGEEGFYRKIAVLHNGYIFTLVKTGALGFLLLVLFYARWWLLLNGKHSTSSANSNPRWQPMLLVSANALLVAQMVNTLIISGMYSLSVTVPEYFMLAVFTGVLIRRRQLQDVTNE